MSRSAARQYSYQADTPKKTRLFNAAFSFLQCARPPTVARNAPFDAKGRV
jgi:hypothetical protein